MAAAYRASRVESNIDAAVTGEVAPPTRPPVLDGLYDSGPGNTRQRRGPTTRSLLFGAAGPAPPTTPSAANHRGDTSETAANRTAKPVDATPLPSVASGDTADAPADEVAKSLLDFTVHAFDHTLPCWADPSWSELSRLGLVFKSDAVEDEFICFAMTADGMWEGMAFVMHAGPLLAQRVELCVRDPGVFNLACLGAMTAFAIIAFLLYWCHPRPQEPPPPPAAAAGNAGEPSGRPSNAAAEGVVANGFNDIAIWGKSLPAATSTGAAAGGASEAYLTASRNWARMHERLALVGYGLAGCVACFTGVAAVPPYQLLPTTVPLYVTPLYPFFIVATAVVTYRVRLSALCVVVVPWIVALCAARAIFPLEAIHQNVFWCLFIVFGIVPFLFFASGKDAGLRARFVFIVKARLALAESREHEAMMWDIVAGVVPKALLRRVRAAKSWRSVAVMDHALRASVSVATFPSFAKWTGTLPPKEVVMLVCRVFSTFDTLLLDHRYAASGLTAVSTAGDTYVVVAGVIGAGRTERRSGGGKRGALNTVVDETSESASRKLTLVVEAAQRQLLATRGMHPNPNFGVAVGVAFGECWGGLHGRVLHHRYILQGSAVKDAVVAAGFGSPNQLMFDAGAVIALSQAAATNVAAREFLSHTELVAREEETRVYIALPAATTQNATPPPVVAASSLATPLSPGDGGFGFAQASQPPLRSSVDGSSVAAFPDLLMVSDREEPNGAGGSGCHSRASPTAATAGARLGAMIDLFNPEEAEALVARENEQQRRRQYLIESANAAAMRDIVSAAETNASSLAGDDGGAHVLRRVVRQTRQVPLIGTYVNRATERGYVKHLAANDAANRGAMAVGLTLLAGACGLSLLADRLFVPEMVSDRDRDIGAWCCFIAAAALAIIPVIVGKNWPTPLPKWLVTFASPLPVTAIAVGVNVLVAAGAASSDSLVSRRPSNVAPVLGCAVLFGSSRVHWFLQPLQLVLLVLLPAMGARSFEFKTTAYEGAYFVAWGVSLIVVLIGAHAAARSARRGFATALLAAELLGASRNKVRTRERLLEGLVPRHLVKTVATLVQGFAMDAQAKRALSRRLTSDPWEQQHCPVPQLSLWSSPFSHEPKCVEVWECTAVAAIQFHVAGGQSTPFAAQPSAVAMSGGSIGGTLNGSFTQDGSAAMMRALVDSSRDLIDTLRVLRTIDAAVKESACDVRVVRVIADSVVVAYLPAPSDATRSSGAPELAAFLCDLAVHAPRRFSAGVTVDMAIGAVVGVETYHHCLMGDALRRAEALLAASPAAMGAASAPSSAWCTAAFVQHHSAEINASPNTEAAAGATTVAFGAAQTWRVRNMGSVAVYPMRLPPSVVARRGDDACHAANVPASTDDDDDDDGTDDDDGEAESIFGGGPTAAGGAPDATSLKVVVSQHPLAALPRTPVATAQAASSCDAPTPLRHSLGESRDGSGA